MNYANVAVNTPVDSTFDYHIPPELLGKLQPGHLVQVQFRTAAENAIVLAIHDTPEVERTKPIIARLDPHPILTEAQIALAWWMSQTYRAPIGYCLWMWLPPGLTGHRDIYVKLREDYPAELIVDAEEEAVVALLKRRGALRGHQLNLSLAGKNWRAAVEGLEKAGVLETESVLAPPRVKPRVIQTAQLAIHPREIPKAARALEKASRAADLLELVASVPGIEAKSALKLSGAKETHLEKLLETGWIKRARDETLTLTIVPEDVPPRLDELRKLEKPLRILNILARANDPVDVSWIYAQADASLGDLKKLEEEDLILLAEQQKWRDSLAEKSFVAAAPPALTPEQETAWKQLENAILWQNGTPLPPVDEEKPHDLHDPKEVNQALDRLERQRRRDPSPAENKLWEAIRSKRFDGLQFRRQQPIERFIVDFYCQDARLVIEVDSKGKGGQYSRDEAAVRQAFLESLGLLVVRFSERDLADDLQDVVKQIAAYVSDQAQYMELEGLEPLPLETHARRGIAMQEETADEPEAPAEPAPESEPPPQNPVFLLHGVTGSGKTELYLRAIDLTLKLGRSAIFLVPEIALTPQTVHRVAARFPGRVAVVHSALSDGERYDTWRRAREGLVQIVVGARSALFTPLENVGLIVLDEEHDASYKQSPPILPPYYNARDLAEAMVRQNSGILILGSATPDVETAYRVERGEVGKLELPRRIMGHRVGIYEQAERAGVLPRYQSDNAHSGDAADALMIDLPPVQVVDMRSELKAGNVSIFSRPLQNSLGDVLQRGEQAILFINRRGQSTFVFCRDCGYIAKCPRCDTPLTHHRAGSALRCHHCGFAQPEPNVCPSCGSKRIKFFGAGTQQVEQTLNEMFPRARVVRWDSDTAASAEAHEAILQRFVERRADVMVGTQMVAKGLDLPLVTLVGVVSADIGLALPDFRAGERTFQVLTQVAGRAGRGLLGGKVVLQTYQPDHYAIATAARHDYAAFYQREIAKRRDIGYPPFRRLVRILFRYPNETQAQREAERAAALLRRRIETLDMSGTVLIGPAPCFFTRENNVFRWQVLLRGPDPTPALDGMDIPRGWYVDVDPAEVL